MGELKNQSGHISFTEHDKSTEAQDGGKRLLTRYLVNVCSLSVLSVLPNTGVHTLAHLLSWCSYLPTYNKLVFEFYILKYRELIELVIFICQWKSVDRNSLYEQIVQIMTTPCKPYFSRRS